MQLVPYDVFLCDTLWIFGANVSPTAEGSLEQPTLTLWTKITWKSTWTRVQGKLEKLDQDHNIGNMQVQLSSINQYKLD